MKENNFLLVRYKTTEELTRGLLLNGLNEVLCHTLEDTYHPLKIYGETRIPNGKYKLELRTFGDKHSEYLDRFGSSFHKGMIWLKNVPNYQGILIHIGNYIKDTLGCILVGEGVGDKPPLLDSTDAYIKVYPILRDSILEGDTYLTITEKLFKDIKTQGLELLELDINKSNNMERIKTMGKVDAKETTELLKALGKLAVSTKQSFDDDGQTTGGDITKYLDDVLPVIQGILGVDKIPAEFADGYDAIEKSEMANELHSALQGLAENDVDAVDAGLEVIYALQNFLIVSGAIKKDEDGKPGES